jgi:hypothetical protein
VANFAKHHTNGNLFREVYLQSIEDLTGQPLPIMYRTIIGALTVAFNGSKISVWQQL